MSSESNVGSEVVSAGRRLSWHAERHPDATVLIIVRPDGEVREVTWGELDAWSNRLARFFAERGVAETSTVAIGLPNCAEHVAACYATWKLGAMTLPLREAMPEPERDAILDLARPTLVISDWQGLAWPNLSRARLARADGYSSDPLPDRLPTPGRAMASSGATGRPKLIVRRAPWGFPPGAITRLLEPIGSRSGGVGFTLGPMYHELPFLAVHFGIFEGTTMIAMEHFDAAMAVDIVERYRPWGMNGAPITLQRIAELPDIKQRDLSSLGAVLHTGAPCPAWVKHAWIDLIGPQHVYEIYGGTEGTGYAMCNGVEWLARPGTVGRAHMAEMKILDDDGREVPRGEVGRIFARNMGAPGIPFEYVGTVQPDTTDDGFCCIGDLGWIDEDGYVYLSDRRVDLIISGGANVFAAEVEGVLSEHPAVADIAVIGLPDATWGKRVHAVVQPHTMESPPELATLDAWCRGRISSYKCPKTYDMIAELPRTEAGKLRRSALVDERIGSPGVAAATDA